MRMTMNDPSRMGTFSLSCLPTHQPYPQDLGVSGVESEARRAEAWDPLEPSFPPFFYLQLMTALPRGTSHLERVTYATAPWCGSSAL